MKKYPILILSCVMMTSIYAEDKKSFDIFKAEYNKKLLQFNSTSEQQQEKIRKLENTIQGQYKKFNEQLIIQQTEHQKQVEHLIQNLDELKNEQKITQNQLIRITESIVLLEKNTTAKSEQLNQSISYRTMSLMLGLLILLGLIGLSYWILRKRQAESNRDLSIQVQQTLESVRLSEEKIVQTDTKLAEQLLEVVMQLKQPQQNVAIGQQQSKPDHSLPLKLADEIHRMRKRLAALPDDTKGLKPLSKSLERLEDQLQEQGYEIIDYTGMKYTENMSVKARFIPSDDLDEGQSIINKVVTPQVNFKGVLIRMADVEVNVG